MFFDNRREATLCGEGEDLCPLTLDGGNPFQFGEYNGGLVIQGHVGSQEVVMGYKQGGQGEGTVNTVKPVGRFDMVFKGSVESFDELLVGSVSLGLISRF